jgi:hypothetical protein
MAVRAVLQTFERYQKERVAFVSAVAEMAKNPQVRAPAAACSIKLFGICKGSPVVWGFVCVQNIEVLQQAGVMALLRPLLLDNVPR